MVLLKIYYHLIAIVLNFTYKIIFGKKYSIGKNTTFRTKFKVAIEGSDSRLEIGDNCFFNNFCSISCMNHIKIGSGTIMGEGVKIYDHNHRFSDETDSLKAQGYSIGEVIIGKNCWIGSNVILLKGANIGDGCVIGAGCVISSKVEPHTIVKNNQNYTIEPIYYKDTKAGVDKNAT